MRIISRVSPNNTQKKAAIWSAVVKIHKAWRMFFRTEISKGSGWRLSTNESQEFLARNLGLEVEEATRKRNQIF